MRLKNKIFCRYLADVNASCNAVLYCWRSADWRAAILGNALGFRQYLLPRCKASSVGAALSAPPGQQYNCRKNISYSVSALGTMNKELKPVDCRRLFKRSVPNYGCGIVLTTSLSVGRV